MTLADLCEPLFLYVCYVVRSVKKAGREDLRRVRGEFVAKFAHMAANAAADRHLATQFGHLRVPLVSFVDLLIEGSDLPFAAEWGPNRLGRAEPSLRQFSEVVKRTLDEPGPAATERLGVLYTCVALMLGLMRPPAQASVDYLLDIHALRIAMVQCGLNRLRPAMDGGHAERLSREADNHVIPWSFVDPPGVLLGALALTLTLLTGLVVVVTHVVYGGYLAAFRQALQLPGP